MADCSCGKRAVYAGAKFLCKEHLREWLEKVLKDSFKRHVTDKDILAVAVSGGKDSTTLLDLVHRAAACRIVAINVDSGISDYSKEVKGFIEKFCKERGIEFHSFSFAKEFGCTLDEMLENRSGDQPQACTVCGTLRRYLVNKQARELGATKVLFAHNRDDEVQTLLMNLFSGNLAQISRKGELVGIMDHPLFVVRLKPWFNVPEKALATFALVNYPELPDVKCPNLKESSRFGARQFLNSLEAKGPGAKMNIMNLYEREVLPSLKPAGRELHQELRECRECGEPSSRTVCKVCEIRKLLCPARKS